MSIVSLSYVPIYQRAHTYIALGNSILNYKVFSVDLRYVFFSSCNKGQTGLQQFDKLNYQKGNGTKSELIYDVHGNGHAAGSARLVATGSTDSHVDRKKNDTVLRDIILTSRGTLG